MNETEYTASSGNLFADMALPNPEERQLKSRLASLVNRIIEQRGLKQQEAARLLEITQPKISDLKHGRLRSFSVEKLLYMLNKLDREVTIVIRPRLDPLQPPEHIAI